MLKAFMARDEGEVRFTMVALAAHDGEKDEEEEAEEEAGAAGGEAAASGSVPHETEAAPAT